MIKINLPTKLTILRLILIPVCMIAIIYPIIPGDTAWRIVAAALFLLTSFTDMLDGMIARRFNMVTDLGKLLDPLADKLLIAGTILAVILRYSADGAPAVLIHILVWSLFIIFTRELAVTLLRSVAVSKSGSVIAAGWLGKIKTVLQMVALTALLLEPILPFDTGYALSYILITAMSIMTIWSGVDYFKGWITTLRD